MLNRFLQCLHHIGVERVILAAVDILEQTALVDALTNTACTLGGKHQFVLQILQGCALNSAGHTLKAQVNHIIGQANGFKQLRTAITGDG